MNIITLFNDFILNPTLEHEYQHAITTYNIALNNHTITSKPVIVLNLRYFRKPNPIFSYKDFKVFYCEKDFFIEYYHKTTRGVTLSDCRTFSSNEIESCLSVGWKFEAKRLGIISLIIFLLIVLPISIWLITKIAWYWIFLTLSLIFCEIVITHIYVTHISDYKSTHGKGTFNPTEVYDNYIKFI